MKINRAVGLIIFLVIAQVLLHDIVSATSRTIVATMGMVEVTSETMTRKVQEIK